MNTISTNLSESQDQGPSLSPKQIVLRSGKVKPFYSHHPWVYPKAIDKILGSPKLGDEIDLLCPKGRWLGRGLWDDQSRIRARLYSWNPNENLDRNFWKRRISQAIELRKMLKLLHPNTGCRLICSEGDLISGLTVDRYGNSLVAHISSLPLFHRRDLFCQLLSEILEPDQIYVRLDKEISKEIGTSDHLILWSGTDRETLSIEENGILFQVQIRTGQKTGFFLDQRENRALVSQLSYGKKVLDCFCYTGGFSLSAAKGGATSVLGIDSSTTAIELARTNARINNFHQIDFQKSDCFTKLNELIAKGERFDLIIQDPPKFSHSRDSIQSALNGYRRLYSLGLSLLQDHGLFIVFCCTGNIQESMIEEVLMLAAREAKRDLRILYRLGPTADHPVFLGCPENRYLKGFVCQDMK